jgi:hypothetical protein
MGTAKDRKSVRAVRQVTSRAVARACDFLSVGRLREIGKRAKPADLSYRNRYSGKTFSGDEHALGSHAATEMQRAGVSRPDARRPVRAGSRAGQDLSHVGTAEPGFERSQALNRGIAARDRRVWSCLALPDGRGSDQAPGTARIGQRARLVSASGRGSGSRRSYADEHRWRPLCGTRLAGRFVVAFLLQSGLVRAHRLEGPTGCQGGRVG